MRCLITGVAGFIGSSLADLLLSDGHQVTGVDCFVDYYPREVKVQNLSAASKNSSFKFIEADLLNTDLGQLLSDCDWVFHQAAQAGVRASWGKYFSTYTDNNIIATQLLLEECRRQKQIQKIVFASSSSVYGDAEQLPTSENLRPSPLSPYGVTKLAAEHLMRLYAHEYGVPTVSLRYFTVYGPRQRPDMAFHKSIRAAIRREEFTVFGDGEQSRDFTYVSDILAANLLAAERGLPGRVYNIGGGSRVTLNQVLDIIRKQSGSLSVRYLERQLGDARHTSADISLARSELGYAPRVSIEDGLGRELEWMRTQ